MNIADWDNLYMRNFVLKSVKVTYTVTMADWYKVYKVKWQGNVLDNNKYHKLSCRL